MRKPVDDLIRCKHCIQDENSLVAWGFYCRPQGIESYSDTPCTTEDYKLCPLNQREFKSNSKAVEGC